MALPDNLFDGYLNITGNLAKSWQNKFSVPKLNINYTPKETTANQVPESTPAGTPAYVRKTFDKDEQFRKMYGTQASRRDRRRFEKYWNSDQRIADQRNFDAAEWDAWDKADRARHNEFMDSIKDPNAIYEDWQKNQQSQVVNQPAVEPIAQQPAPVAPVNKTNWLAKAQEYGFNSLDDVKKWQTDNGLVADGMFGAKSITKYNELQRIKQQNAETERMRQVEAEQMRPVAVEETAANSPVSTSIPQTHPTKSAETPKNVTFDWNAFVSDNGLKYETIDGKKYALYDPWGMGEFRIDEDGHVYDHRYGPGWLKSTDDNLNITSKTSAYYDYDNYKDLMNMMNRYTQRRKQGGIMQINKFQQGGAQPNIQQQVKQLVRQVASGDKEAAAQVKQIMEAAKKGDEKALQIAKLIEQEIQAIQKDKQGAKINYIRHLKGKCPEGEELVYFKKGGLITCGCQKKQNGAKLEKVNAVEEFKRRRRKA